MNISYQGGPVNDCLDVLHLNIVSVPVTTQDGLDPLIIKLYIIVAQLWISPPITKKRTVITWKVTKTTGEAHHPVLGKTVLNACISSEDLESRLWNVDPKGCLIPAIKCICPVITNWNFIIHSSGTGMMDKASHWHTLFPGYRRDRDSRRIFRFLCYNIDYTVKCIGAPNGRTWSPDYLDLFNLFQFNGKCGPECMILIILMNRAPIYHDKDLIGMKLIFAANTHIKFCHTGLHDL